MSAALASIVRRPFSAGAPWRIMAPLVVVHVLMLASAALGLHAIAREVDRSDSARAGEAVTAAFNYQLSRLEMVTVNNAVYTEAWRAVGGARVDTRWALENWTVAPPDLPGHHGIVLLGADGRPIIGTRAGRPMSTAEMARLASLSAATVRRVAREGESSAKGLVTTGSIPTLVAAANVVPEASDRTPASMRGPKRRLVLVHPIDQRLLATMNQTIGGEQLRLSRPGRSATEVPLAADAGETVALTWRSREPGRAAMVRSLRIIAPVLLLVTLLLVFVMRAGLASSRALRRAATVDALTGLPNRAAFSAEFDDRVAAGRHFVLGLIDLDGFKDVNDRHGHPAGDALLARFGAILTRVAEPADFVGRLGGDEFAFLCGDLASAERLSVRLRLELSRPVDVGARSMRIGASVGLATGRPGRSSSEVMGEADVELYADKLRRRIEHRPDAPALEPAPPRLSA